MKSTQAMRDRIRELMQREQDDYDRAVECVLDDLEGMLAVAQKSPWQPIATAPKDRKIDLLFPGVRGRTIDCEWRQGDVYGDGGWFWSKPKWDKGELLPESEWFTECYPNMQPTHWMERPASALPSTDRGTGDGK
jgi:hypothetical protein